MIAGIFGGRTVKALTATRLALNIARGAFEQKHALREADHLDNLDQAIADRAAAIRELRDEILEIQEIK
jgi:hypothetical protein